MIMKANKQIGFIYKDNESIDKILKDGDVVFERGFLRERTSTTLPINFGGVGKDLKDYRVHGNTKQQILPDGYTQVEYIESSGTQYIDTGVNADNKLDIKYDVEKTTSGGLVSGTIYNDNGSYTRYHIGINNDKYSFYILQDSSLLTITNDANIKHSFYINTTTRKVTIDGIDYQLPNTTLTDTQLNFWLFRRNSNINNLRNYGTFKLYSCKMYYENILVRDFIPCYRNSDNEVGLYDLVNDVFYTNQGTGVFTYGSVAPTPDAPIEIVSCGDRTGNLFDKNTTTKNEFLDSDGNIVIRTDNVWYLSDYISVNPNKNYTYQGLTFVGTAPYSAYYDINKNFISTFKQKVGQNTILIPNNAYYVRFSIINRELNQDLPTFMFEEGSTATSYEPYGYKIPVNVRSKNLFDKDDINIEDNKYLTSDGSYYGNVNFKISDYIPIKSSTIYNLSPYKNYSAYECFYDENKTFISSIQISSINNTFTTPTNAKYIRLSVRKTDNDGLMLVEDSTTPTKYQPYYNETTNIYLDEPLRKIDEYSDYIDFANGKVVRQLGEVILDGNTNALTYYGTYGTYNAPLFYMNKSDLIIPSSYNKKIIFASHYRQYLVNSEGAGGMFNYGIRGATASRRIYIRDDRYNNSNDINDWLSENNVTVDYVLETPTEESITLPNIPTINGNNTLNIETEITPSQVYIKYKSNE